MYRRLSPSSREITQRLSWNFVTHSGTKGTEELGNARSNKNRRGGRTLKNICTVNAKIGLNWVMFQNIY